MGPLAGLAAGLGLAALASHFGFGEELASFMMMALLAMVVIGVIGYFMRKKAAAQGNQGMQYAGAGAPFGGNAPQREFTPAGGAAAAPVANSAGNIPADFDVDGFVRNAKVNFIRLQAANDAGNLDDIREFTSPEMFAEIKMGIDERKGAKQTTDVAQLNAEVLDVAEEAGRYIVSVHFNGLIREEDGAAAQPFAEVWHMAKPRDGSRAGYWPAFSRSSKPFRQHQQTGTRHGACRFFLFTRRVVQPWLRITVQPAAINWSN
jgi:predicted lipid-binding transport protein (Tim44 family)